MRWRVVTLALLGLGCSGGRAEPPAVPAEAVQATSPVLEAVGSVPAPGRALPALAALPDGPALKPDIRVCAGGDVMLGNNLDSAWALRASQRLGIRVPPLPDPTALTLALRPLVADADVVLINVEGAIGSGSAPGKCRPGSTSCYAFRQTPEAASAIRALGLNGVVIGNVANNHAMDAGRDGFAATVAHLVEQGVHVTGADTLATVVTTARGDTLAVLGFSTFQAGADARDLPAVARHVRRARAAYGRVIVTMHMGAEGARAQRTPQEAEIFLGENRGNSVAFARTAVAAGAAAVIGHGPHVMRAAEWVGDAFVAYSLGNLLTYGPFNLSEPLNRGGFLCLSIDATGAVARAELRSTEQRAPGLARRDRSHRAAVLLDSLSGLDFPESGALLDRGGRLVRRGQ